MKIPKSKQAGTQARLNRSATAQRKLAQAKWDDENARRDLFGYVWKALGIAPGTDGSVITDEDGDLAFMVTEDEDSQG